MDRLSDEQLINQVMGGDRSALETLVERYHGPLLGYLFRLTNGNRSQAEDLVQETFIQLLRQTSYQPGRPFKPWLYSIATHLAIDYFRSPAANPSISVDSDEWVEPSDPAPGPEQQQLLNSEGEIVRVAISELDKSYQAAVLLRFYQGLTLEEIAFTLQIPLGTVKSRLSVGIQRLRGLLIRLDKGAGH
jgi:RNA polymerase sigma-70 factor (ECF subfamily)